MNRIKNIVKKVVRYSQLFLGYVKKAVEYTKEYMKELSKELGELLVIVAGLVTLINLFMLEVNDVIETVKNTINLLFL